MSFIERFSDHDLPPEAVAEILEYQAGSFESEAPTDHCSYLEERRRYIGPAADITHPEFGRENRPEETYAVFYHVTAVPKYKEGRDDENNKVYVSVLTAQIVEWVLDSDRKIIATQEV